MATAPPLASAHMNALRNIELALQRTGQNALAHAEQRPLLSTPPPRTAQAPLGEHAGAHAVWKAQVLVSVNGLVDMCKALDQRRKLAQRRFADERADMLNSIAAMEAELALLSSTNADLKRKVHDVRRPSQSAIEVGVCVVCVGCVWGVRSVCDACGACEGAYVET